MTPHVKWLIEITRMIIINLISLSPLLVFTDKLHNKRISRRVHPHRLRQLFCKCDGWWEAHKFGSMGKYSKCALVSYQLYLLIHTGYSRSGRLRSTTSTLVSTNRCLLNMFFIGQSGIVWERQSQMVSGSASSLSIDAYHIGGNKIRFTRW